MEINTKGLEIEEDNFFNEFMFRFFPYWPLFTVLFVSALILAFGYLLWSNPTWSISATVLIKDEKQGVDNPSILQATDISNSTNIVENEMQIFNSRTLLRQAVMKLNLYAPIYSDQPVFRTVPAYALSPVVVQVKDTAHLDTATSALKMYFNYDSTKHIVNMTNVYVKLPVISLPVLVNAENKNLPLNEWIKTPYGTFRFVPNPRYKRTPELTLFGDTTTYPLWFTLTAPEKVVYSLSQNLVVSQPNNNGTVVTLTLPDQTIQRGKDILNELIYGYDSASINDQNQFASKTLVIIKGRMTQLQHQLDSIQNLINQYKVKNGITDLTQQSSQYLQNAGLNEQQVADINRQMAVMDEVEKYVNSKDQKSGIIPSTLDINNQVLTDLLKQLSDQEINYERLRMTASENNPTLITLSNQIARTKSDILENTRIEKISLKAGRDNLVATGNIYASQLKDLPDKERALVEISRQLTVLTSTYNFLLQKQEETAITFASTIPDDRVVDYADLASIYPSPSKVMVLAIAGVLAMGIGLVIVLKKEFFNPKLLFRSDIDKFTTIPVVGEIVDIDKKKKSFIDPQKNPVSAEQFRHLATAIGLYEKNIRGKKLLITSSIKGEGKTFVSTNLAITLASAGKKVIILDLDLRNPQISTMFNVDHEAGITEFLEGERESYEIIKHSEYDNLFVASAGTTSTVQSKLDELLLNENLKVLFNYLEEVFDFIIMDTPPVEPVSDACVLGKYSDSTLFVIRHRYTTKATVRLLDKSNKIKSLKNIAIVFNGVKARGFIKHAYGYGYGFGYENVYTQKVKG